MRAAYLFATFVTVVALSLASGLAVAFLLS